MKSSFIIIADRGNLKAFRVEKVPNGRQPHLELVQAFTLVDAHLKISEINTDMAGRFPVGSTPGQSQGRHQNAIAEKGHQFIEMDRRIVRQLADHINSVLRQEKPGSWSFAAPAMINRAVIEEVEPNFQKQLVDNVSADLVNAETSALLDHFTGLRAA